MRISRRHSFRAVALGAAISFVGATMADIAQAQVSNTLTPVQTDPAAGNKDPVTFSADAVEYDKENALVTATGHVEAWQNGHVMRADKVVFDRNTGVAAGTGNVVLLEPDGEVMFADYAEMQNHMNDGILKDVRALLRQNGKLAANGVRRTGGQINEMSQVVYTTCDQCKTDPSRAPLWQIRAESAVQDVEHKKVEFSNATLDMFGVPVAFFPYFWTADPSVKRESGLLPPIVGSATGVGFFYGQPYYQVIDDQSDATILPLISTQAGPQLDVEYRRRFNDGSVLLNVSAGDLNGTTQGSIGTRGQFAIDDTWRWGFDLNRASSVAYVYDFHVTQGLTGDENVLPSQLYLEGFGEGSYSRLESKFYQGLNGVIDTATLPTVLPRYEYSYFGTPDSLGGRLSLTAGAFNVIRTIGTDTQRASTTVDWVRPFTGLVGDLWNITLHGDAAAYNATGFQGLPNYGPYNMIDTARALPQMAINFRWPFSRDGGAWGTQVIEPIVQLIAAPQTGTSQLRMIPNEDSLDFEFTDANLFGFNRFTGIDRLDGGERANVGLHGAWYLGGTTFDGLVGQAYRTNKDTLFPQSSGLYNQVSDIVARATFAPTKWLDLTYRTRLDPTTLATHFSDAVVSAGPEWLRVSGGYIYTNFNPFTYYDQPLPPPYGNAYYFPRNEATVGVTAKSGYYKFTANVQRDLASNQMVMASGDASYEDECSIFDLRYYRIYTNFNGFGGTTAIMFLFTLKTIGQFGYRAL